jgi:hypothetical protein
MSAVSSQMSTVRCQLCAVCCVLSAVCFLLSAFCSSAVCYRTIRHSNLLPKIEPLVPQHNRYSDDEAEHSGWLLQAAPFNNHRVKATTHPSLGNTIIVPQIMGKYNRLIRPYSDEEAEHSSWLLQAAS